MTKTVEQNIWENLESQDRLKFVEYKICSEYEETDEIIIPNDVYMNTTNLQTRFGVLPCLKVHDTEGNEIYLKISSKSLRRQILGYLGKNVIIFRRREGWGYSYQIDEA